MERVISVIGLGYVGLPLACAFGKKYSTIGFDINATRIDELKKGIDRTGEIDDVAEIQNKRIQFTNNLQDLKQANFHIVAVPTPIDAAKRPDLKPLLSASATVGQILKKGDFVIFESTVYPGATEEDCIPVLEAHSKLKAGIDFFVGYSPERINPSDRERTITKITKIVSAQTTNALEIVAEVYGSIITAGIHKAPSIKVAEAAKVIENTQRDLNIALINELAIIFDKLNINTTDVLNAASTKWNFLPFKPGLVGGHCIGVDPYYLTFKSEVVNYHPQVILAGRRINDDMGFFIARKAIKKMIQTNKQIKESRVTIFGFTFKENCPDTRNTRVVDIIKELQDHNISVQVCDPVCDPSEALHEYGIEITPIDKLQPANCLIIAVAHDEFKKLTKENIFKLLDKDSVVIDVKSLMNQDFFKGLPISYWSL